MSVVLCMYLPFFLSIVICLSVSLPYVRMSFSVSVYPCLSLSVWLPLSLFLLCVCLSPNQTQRRTQRDAASHLTLESLGTSEDCSDEIPASFSVHFNLSLTEIGILNTASKDDCSQQRMAHQQGTPTGGHSPPEEAEGEGTAAYGRPLHVRCIAMHFIARREV